MERIDCQMAEVLHIFFTSACDNTSFTLYNLQFGIGDSGNLDPASIKMYHK